MTRIARSVRRSSRLFTLISFIILYSSSIQIAFALINNEGIQVYQRNLHLSAMHKKKLAAAISRYHSADNLWDVLRDEFSLYHYDRHPAVRNKIYWFMNNQDYLMRSATRAIPYLYYISQQVRKRHLPAEIVLLPIIESSYNPFSLSNMGAAGLWQLMPDTATGLGIRQDTWYDGRRDIIASTKAALNHLSYLQNYFDGNWLLALAAYNTGEGNVSSAIRRNIRYGYDTDFWSLPLAQQTRDYVPSLLALAVIISHPEQYPVYFPPVKNAPYLAQVPVGKRINLKHAASLAGLSYQKLLMLNPGFNQVSTKRPSKLILPIENVEKFAENLAASPLSNGVNWLHYRVKHGDSLISISKKFKTTVLAIRKMNHLAHNDLQQGTNLLIPHNSQKPATKKIATHRKKRNYLLRPGDTIYMVRLHDTLKRIAKRFHVSAQHIMLANHLKNGKIKYGEQIVIPTHIRHGKLEPGDTIYQVRRGDTIEKIANKFGITPAAIRLANVLDDNLLIEGEKLVVPTHLSS